MHANKYNIVEDKTGGLLKLIIARRIGDARNYYVRNNLDGRFVKGDIHALQKVVNELNKNLPNPTPGETIVGFAEGSLILASMLALIRKTNFVCSTKTQKSNKKNEIKFFEEHRRTLSAHYIYALEKRDKVILFEDEISTGKTIINAFQTLKKIGINIVAIITVTEVLNFSGRENINRETGLDLQSLCKIRLL